MEVKFTGEEPNEAQKELIQEVQRLTQFANWLIATDKAAVAIIDTHVHKNLMRAELTALSNLVIRRLGVDSNEFTRMVVAQIQQDIMLYQMDHKIIITPEGIIQEPQK